MNADLDAFASTHLTLSPASMLTAVGMAVLTAFGLWWLLRRPLSVALTLVVLLVSSVATGLGHAPLIHLMLFIECSVSPPDNGFLSNLSEAFLTAAIPEESVKFGLSLCFLRILRVRRDSGVVLLVAAVALGFAVFENMMAALTLTGPLGVLVTRSLTTVLHACGGIVMGHFLARAQALGGRRWIPLLVALIVPILLHGAYDLAVLSFQSYEMPELPEDRLPEEVGPVLWGFALMGLVALATLIEITWAIIIVIRRRQAPETPGTGGLPMDSKLCG